RFCRPGVLAMTTKPARADSHRCQTTGFPASFETVRKTAMAGVSLLALGLGMAVLPAGVARAEDTRTVVNGAAGGGVILLDQDAADNLSAGGYSVTDGILASGGFAAVLEESGAVADMVQVGGIVAGAVGDYSISDTIFTNFL